MSDVIGDATIVGCGYQGLTMLIMYAADEASGAILRRGSFYNIGDGFYAIEVYSRGSSHTGRGATRMANGSGACVVGFVFCGCVGTERANYAQKFAIVTMALCITLAREVNVSVIDYIPVFATFFISGVGDLLLANCELTVTSGT